jgi:hypothetical protein
MHFQHQPQMAALQQHHQQQQMHGVGVGGMVGGVLGHQMQDRGQYYGDAGDDGTTSSQPMAMGLPLNYAQVPVRLCFYITAGCVCMTARAWSMKVLYPVLAYLCC